MSERTEAANTPQSHDGREIKAEEFVKRTVRLDLTLDLIYHPEVFERVDDDWRSGLYDLHDDEDIATHLLFNLLQGRSVDRLDGWADLPRVAAYIENIDRLYVDDIEDAEPVPDFIADNIGYHYKYRGSGSQRDGGES